jgi:hypothetical protein
MNTKYMFIVAAMTVVLVGATALATEDASAYKKNQAVYQTNACGNGDMAMNVGCQNIESQIQGDNNRVATAAAQSFDN